MVDTVEWVEKFKAQVEEMIDGVVEVISSK